MDSAEILQALRALEKKLDACLEGQALLASVLDELSKDVNDLLDDPDGLDDEDDEDGEGGPSLVDALQEVVDAALEEGGKQARRATRRRR